MTLPETVSQHVREHPYLWCNALSVTWLTVFGRLLLDRPAFRLSVISGLLNAPCFFFLVLLEGTYWSPVRLGGWRLDPGDVLCSYAVAAMAWFALNLCQSRQLQARFVWRVFLRRYHLVAVASILVFLLAFGAGLDGMPSLLVACLMVGGGLYVRLRPMRRLALEGALRFALLYLVVVKLYFGLWPDFVHQWNLAAPLGRLVAGIPAGEIIWSLLFGAYWTLFMTFVFQIEAPGKPVAGDEIMSAQAP